MKFLTQYSIRTKLIVIMMITSLSGVVAAGISFIYLERNIVKDTTFQELTLLGEIIANRSSAALLFDDTKLAQENLDILKAKTNVIQACILDGNMQVFSSYLTSERANHNLNCEFENKNNRFGVFEVGEYISARRLGFR